MQVCDTFDCMISGMECKRISVQQALETMIEAADLLFERKIVKSITENSCILSGRYENPAEYRRNRNRCMPDGQFYPSGRCCLRSG